VYERACPGVSVHPSAEKAGWNQPIEALRERIDILNIFKFVLRSNKKYPKKHLYRRITILLHGSILKFFFLSRGKKIAWTGFIFFAIFDFAGG
jgi:hypothetical protein